MRFRRGPNQRGHRPVLIPRDDDGGSARRRRRRRPTTAAPAWVPPSSLPDILSTRRVLGICPESLQPHRLLERHSGGPKLSYPSGRVGLWERFGFLGKLLTGWEVRRRSLSPASPGRNSARPKLSYPSGRVGLWERFGFLGKLLTGWEVRRGCLSPACPGPGFRRPEIVVPL